MEASTEGRDGTIFTFYSYKGGVGRTMALANSAALLAKWGHSVLVIDWDLEAPGVERFFLGVDPNISRQRMSKPGVVDLIDAKASGRELDWLDCVIEVHPFEGTSVSVISAGRSDENYISRVQALDLQKLFREKQLGSYLEKLRSEWTSLFDFVLVDSRTGITDIGGICTIHLPDILVLLFTATDPSVDGVIDVLKRSRFEQAKLPFDRRHLLALPVPARDESRTELERATRWKRIFAQKFAEYYKDWLPVDKSPADALEVLRIPYVPYWSFGESLPVVEEGTSDPSSLGFAYQSLARFIATKLAWNNALSGEFVARPAPRVKRDWNLNWLQRERERALKGLRTAGWKGFVEVRFFSHEEPTTPPLQDHLLNVARLSAIHTFGWPIGVVFDSRDARPRPTSEGIVAEIASDHSYDYWTLTAKAEFYTLMSLFEDFRSKNVIFVDTQIVRTTEALLYCSKLLHALGSSDDSSVTFGLSYGGLMGRTLGVASPSRGWLESAANSSEDSTSTELILNLGAIESDLVKLVETLCAPLFVLFDFTRVQHGVYEDIVLKFREGKIN
jgi:MinD-like ATPase involved in chromosome partitioning or flagellar assembly